jgi:hypothetical protein
MDIEKNILEPRCKEHSLLREKFIKMYIDSGLSYSQVGKSLGISKQRVYQIYHYGYVNSMRANITSRERMVQARDKNRCRICRKSKVTLHIHHLDGSKDNRLQNLITLCSSCHGKFEKYTKDLKKINPKLKVGKLLETTLTQYKKSK